jgi:Na+/melibiose symporter-like transporter
MATVSLAIVPLWYFYSVGKRKKSPYDTHFLYVTFFKKKKKNLPLFFKRFIWFVCLLFFSSNQIPREIRDTFPVKKIYILKKKQQQKRLVFLCLSFLFSNMATVYFPLYEHFSAKHGFFFKCEEGMKKKREI